MEAHSTYWSSKKKKVKNFIDTCIEPLKKKSNLLIFFLFSASNSLLWHYYNCGKELQFMCSSKRFLCSLSLKNKIKNLSLSLVVHYSDVFGSIDIRKEIIIIWFFFSCCFSYWKSFYCYTLLLLLKPFILRKLWRWPREF